MNQEPLVRFSVARAGWLPLEIAADGKQLNFTVSAVPNDFLAELAGALIAILSGMTRAEAVMNQEPEQVELIFSFEGDQEMLEIRCYRDHRRQKRSVAAQLVVHASRQGLTRSFWRALCELQGSVDAEEFAQDWGHPFPAYQVQSLSEFL